MITGGRRRRRTSKPAAKIKVEIKPKETTEKSPEARVEEPKISASRHPMCLNEGRMGADGKLYPMPHELEAEEFLEWLILNGMTEGGYQESVKLGDSFLADIKKNGRPIPTDKLDPDQRGWAKADYPAHYNNPVARWRPVKGKTSKVEPFKVKLLVHDREYRNACDCKPGDVIEGEEITGPDLHFWGTRWDGKRLDQCWNCGEVILHEEPKPEPIIEDEPSEEDDE